MQVLYTLSISIKNKILLPCLIIIVLATGRISAQVTPIPSSGIWQRSRIIPVPSFVDGVSDFKKEISEGWYVKNDPAGDMPSDMASEEGWEPIVKGRNSRRRITGASSLRLFKQEIIIPESFKGKRIIIRFGGVAHAARLYVNGSFVRDHWGSFMAWTADITGFVKDGKALLAVYVDEESTGLASFIRGGGIQKEVTLFTVPQNYIVRANAETDLDDDYADATLRLKMKIEVNEPLQNNRVRISLAGPDGKNVRITPSEFSVTGGAGDFYIEGRVNDPVKWDAEHPNLCKMTVSLLNKDKIVESIERNIGFREIERRGRHVFVNGQEVKFRGMWGGNDAKQLRDLNVNHTRQKWATESFLDSCDHYGVYVLDETPVDFAKYGPEIDPELAYQYLSLVADLIERDYSHPSVVMWGIANESFHGPNVLNAYHFIKEEDTQRQVMFSWSNRVKPTEELPFDIYSFHYPNVLFGPHEMRDYGASYWMANSLVKERAIDPELPVICDEYAHTVLNPEERNRDPNVRNFWGEGIKLFWDYIYNTPGALGGDQFGMFSSLNAKVDIPEVWLLRKGYSPVHLEQDHFDLPQKGQPLTIGIQNRFCHTNMNEITLRWKSGDRSGSMKCPDLPPSESGILSIPAGQVKTGDLIGFRFLRKDGFQVDEYALRVSPRPFELPEVSDKAPVLSEDERYYTIRGDDFEIQVDKYLGLITSGIYKGQKIITYGPMLQFTGSNLELREWWCDNLSVQMEGSEAVVHIFGNYAGIWVTFEVRIDGEGLITTNYTIRRFPDPPPAFQALPWNGTHNGGFSEVGIIYELSEDIDRLEWDRKALWSVYPPNHIGAPKGTAFKLAPESQGVWGTYTDDSNTSFGWSAGMQAGSGEARFTNNFRGMKEYIRTATALLENSDIGIQVISEGTDAVRMSHPTWRGRPGIFMIIDNLWNYPQLGLGNHMKDPVIIQEGYKNCIRMRFYSSDINH